jgi:hypothetical protein
MDIHSRDFPAPLVADNIMYAIARGEVALMR